MCARNGCDDAPTGKMIPTYVIVDTEDGSVIFRDPNDPNCALFTEETAKDGAQKRNELWGEDSFVVYKLVRFTDPTPGWWEQ